MQMQIKLRRAAALGALLAMAAGAQAQDDAERAHVAYESGRYAVALALYEQMSDLGDMAAAERAGEMLLLGERLYGKQVGRDPRRAMRHLLRAATAGSLSSIYWLGRLGIP